MLKILVAWEGGLDNQGYATMGVRRGIVSMLAMVIDCDEILILAYMSVYMMLEIGKVG